MSSMVFSSSQIKQLAFSDFVVLILANSVARRGWETLIATGETFLTIFNNSNCPSTPSFTKKRLPDVLARAKSIRRGH